MSWCKDKIEYYKEIIKNTAETINKSELTIERDIIQSLFLYKLNKKNQNIVFKGGTSLSKVFNLIDRFSEDLDLSLSEKPTESEKRKISELIESIGNELGLHLENPDEIKERYSYNKYQYSYNSLFTDNIQHIVIETNFYQVVYPIENIKVCSYVDSFIEKIDNNEIKELKQNLSFEMPVQCLERTFIDKVFAICDYYIQNMQERDSRHLYDICKLYNNIDFDDSFKNLFNKVRQDRMNSKNNPSAQPQYKIHDMLKEIIKTRFYEKDYNEITIKLLYDDVNYDKAINNGIKKLVETNIIKEIEEEQKLEIKDIKNITSKAVKNHNNPVNTKNNKNNDDDTRE